MDVPAGTPPVADPAAEPDGFVVLVGDGLRVHFLDWGGSAGPADPSSPPPAVPGALLIHGLSQTAWTWTPVARRLRGALPTVALDLRGHGLSDAPTEDPAGEYAIATLAGDAIAVAEGSGLLAEPGDRVVIAGHGFGAIVGATAALELAERCAGLLLVDGGWERLEAATGLDVEEFLRGLEEPPEVMASLDAFLADRAGFDPATWDGDQDRAARATVVETHAGRVVPATRPHALEASIRAMFTYDPLGVLPRVTAPLRALVAADDEHGSRRRALEAVSAACVAAGHGPIDIGSFPHDGHNLMRYRPTEVTAAILGLAERARG